MAKSGTNHTTFNQKLISWSKIVQSTRLSSTKPQTTSTPTIIMHKKLPQCSIKYENAASTSTRINRRRKSNEKNLQKISSSLLLFLINSSTILSSSVSRMNACRSRHFDPAFCWFTSQFCMSFNIEFHYQLSMWMDDKLIDSYVKYVFTFFFAILL